MSRSAPFARTAAFLAAMFAVAACGSSGDGAAEAPPTTVAPSTSSSTSSTTTAPPRPADPKDRRPFGDRTPWNTPIPEGAALDPAGSRIVGYLSGGGDPRIANLYSFGVPVFDAGPATPGRRVSVDIVILARTAKELITGGGY